MILTNIALARSVNCNRKVCWKLKLYLTIVIYDHKTLQVLQATWLAIRLLAHGEHLENQGRVFNFRSDCVCTYTSLYQWKLGPDNFRYCIKNFESTKIKFEKCNLFFGDFAFLCLSRWRVEKRNSNKLLCSLKAAICWSTFLAKLKYMFGLIDNKTTYFEYIVFITEDWFTKCTNITTKLKWKLFTKVIKRASKEAWNG